jgi:hypothetical protein
MKYYFYLLLADFFAASSYPLANYIAKNGEFISSSEVFAYSNFYIVLLLLIFKKPMEKKYNFKLFNFWKKLSIGFVFAIFLSVFSSLLKTILLSGAISQLTLKSYSSFSPYITMILCDFLLVNQKINKQFLIALSISFFGFMFFNNFNFDFLNFNAIYLVLFYLFINSFSDFLLKKYSDIRGIDMSIFDNLMFFFVSISVFTVAVFFEEHTVFCLKMSKFSLTKLLSIKSAFVLVLVALTSFFAHNFKMLSYKISHIAGILVFGIFSKNLMSIYGTYIGDRILPTYHQITGLFIISLGVLYFAFKKKYAKNN